jgi:S-adenosylmethionine:tRNA ribosyltransferase-isomerase
MVKTSDFAYHLPKHMIAQTPVEPRDSSRLLVLHRQTGELEHKIYCELGEYLRGGDLLVLNRTRVIPGRIYARRPSGGRVEILLLRKHDPLTWHALIGGRRLSAGRQLMVEGGPAAEVISELEGAERLIRFSEPIEASLTRIGHVPLPPYIHEPLQDPDRYQTVYAEESGSAAAPTAGLHFTPGMLERLEHQGVRQAFVTLHVGLDTFAPVLETDASKHSIHTEWCDVPSETAALINATRKHSGRVIAVGTTSVRALETAARSSNLDRSTKIAPFSGDTDLYILPGFAFTLVDAMITNFHLPESTLLMLVSAFAGRELILRTYEIAKREGYRFYSFGDAMLIL